MIEQGFYTPHVKVYYNCRRDKLTEPNHACKLFSITMTLNVCTEPPSKKDFISALYKIASTDYGKDFDTPIRGDGPTLSWI